MVLPVAAVAEKSGTFLNWEGRARLFEAALKPDQMTRRHPLPDARVLHMLADAHGRAISACRTSAPRARELDRLGGWDGPTPDEPRGDRAAAAPARSSGEAVLAGHRLLLDQGRLQEGDEALAGTRHAAVARLSRGHRAETGVKDGDLLAVTGPAGSVALPLQVTPMPDRVVWLPLNSAGGGVAADTGALPGDLVQISAAPGLPEPAEEVDA